VRRRLGLCVAVAAALALSGCAAPAADDALADLRSTVVAIADQAAAGDTAGALSALAALEAEVQNAAADGHLTSERAAAVQQSIDLVRADLQPAATPEPTASTPPDDSGTASTVDDETEQSTDDGSDSGGEDTDGSDDADEAVEAPTPVAPPVVDSTAPAAPTTESGPGGDNKGPGNNNGKGPGDKGGPGKG
jgi:hypothetical protein